jgi:hypothetical protein
MNDVGVTNTQVPVQPVSASADPRLFNPGVKPTGAPVPFTPGAQQSMVNMYGAPMQGSFDRQMSAPQQPPVAVKTPVTPNYNLSTL